MNLYHDLSTILCGFHIWPCPFILVFMDGREVSVFQNCKMSQATQNLTAVLPKICLSCGLTFWKWRPLVPGCVLL